MELMSRVECLAHRYYEAGESVTHSLSPRSFSELDFLSVSYFKPAAGGPVALLVTMSDAQTA